MSAIGRRHILLAALILFSLSACSSVPSTVGEMTLSARDLTSTLDKRFPVERVVGSILGVTLSAPRVTISDAALPLVVKLDASVRIPFVGGTIAGQVTVSGRPEYIHQIKAVYLRAPEVIHVQMDTRLDKPVTGNMPTMSADMGKAAAQAAIGALSERPLMRFSPEELKKHGLENTAAQFAVRGNALVLRDVKLTNKSTTP